MAAKSLAGSGLRRGQKPGVRQGGPQPGSVQVTKSEQLVARRFAKALLKRPKFRKMLQAKLDDLTLHPSIVSLLMYYGYGKPREEIDVKQTVPVRIVHEYADGK